MTIDVHYWKQNSLELYGYGSPDYVQTRFKVSSTITLCQSGASSYIKKDGETESADAEAICQIVKKSGALYIEGFTVKCVDELWFPIKHKPSTRGQVLIAGFQIRFGRMRYLVNAVELDPQPVFEASAEISVESYEVVCRICLSGSRSTANPLLSLCLCTGTLGLIHFRCAAALVLSKMRRNDNTAVDSFHMKSVECELCHAMLPHTYVENEVSYNLYELFKPVSPYVMLTKASDPTEVHFLHPTLGKSILIGRGRNCDMKLTDSSVSRVHATITLTNAGFLLKDEDSKFGTFQRAQDEFWLPSNKEVVAQVGQSVIYLKAATPWKCFKCCGCCLQHESKTGPPTNGVDKDGYKSSKSIRRDAEDPRLETDFPFL